MVFDYDALPREFVGRYLPPDLKFEWEGISKVFAELSSRPLTDVSSLEKWLLDQAEFDAYLYEQRTIRYINSTRHTDNPEFTNPYEQYLQELEPKIKVASFDLLKKYASNSFRGRLPPLSYGLEDRRREAAVRVFRIENVELEKQDSTLAQKYMQTIGAMTVIYRGQERTLQQMVRFLEEPERPIREEAWRLVGARALQDRDTLDEIFDRMVQLRDEAARNAGFENFEDFTFVRKNRFDYTPGDCLKFHEAIEEHIVPLSREIDRRRRENLGLDVLRPWDLNVDPHGRPPLSPFNEVEELVRGAAKVVGEVDPKLSAYFAQMVELELLDLDSRKGKAPGGYQEELSELKLPFIFMNAARRDNDVRVLLHEAGHSFQTFLMRDSGLPYFNSNQNLPSEIAEVASTSMEIVSGEHYEGTFYGKEEARRSNWYEAVSNVKLLTWVAAIDAFQHWVYTHPAHTREERRAAWARTFDRFGGLEDYEGLEASREYRWQRQLHLFEVPFYYIEYAIALTGALGIWARYKKDRKDAIEAYKGALSLGASRSIPEFFECAGLEWGFGSSAFRKHANSLRAAIREYGA